MDKDTRVDLHIHTTASDGTWTPAETVAAVRAASVGLFAVTDHDTAANVAATGRLAAEAGLGFLPGVEISVTLAGHLFHILGYGIDPEGGALRRILAANTALMEEVDHDSIRKLAAAGFPIAYDEFCAYDHDPGRGGWKSLSYLIDKGLCTGVGDFFAELFNAKRGIVFPEFPHPAAAIAAIKEAGGVPVLAHPGSEFHGPALEETLDMFAAQDIEGVECFHLCHDAVTTKRAVEWCDRHKLLITGGSDCHGGFVPSRRLGVPEITLGQLRLGKLADGLPDFIRSGE
jgi:predicted metal-dependent phosphoesterase TrpH